MKPLLETMNRALGRLTGSFHFVGQVALGLMVITICYDVVMRYAFMAPTTWSLEVNTFLVLFITLIPAADVLRSDDQLRITFFAAKLGPSSQKAVAILTSVLGCGFSAVMTWKGLNMAIQAFRYDERMSTALGTPLGIPYLFLPIGFGLLLLQYLILLLGAVTGSDAKMKK